MDSAQGSDLAPFLGDSSQSEKFSDIKPPLGLEKRMAFFPIRGKIKYTISPFPQLLSILK